MELYKTNFAVLTDVYQISGLELSEQEGIDRSLISRWRSGNRKLTKKTPFVPQLTTFFMELDASLEKPFLLKFLKIAMPFESVTKNNLEEKLSTWLIEPNQDSSEKTPLRLELFVKFHEQVLTKAVPTKTEEKAKLSTEVLQGEAAAQRFILSLEDYIIDLSEPADITFVCPEGLELITKNESFAKKFFKKLEKIFRGGHNIKVVLRTDFKLSDVAAFSGPWLVAHLTGKLRSQYYDDFRQIETDKIMVCIGENLCAKISGEEILCQTFKEQRDVAQMKTICDHYLANSKQRFHYSFFKDPQEYLKGVPTHITAPVYLFQRLPHFGLNSEEMFAALHLKDKEIRLLKKEFAPLFLTPNAFEEDVPVQHLFSSTAIEKALDNNQHTSAALTDMLGRRSIMNTQTLVNQLVEIKRLLTQRENYHACFVGDDIFDKFVMEIAVFGNTTAIGWIGGRQSTACKDFTNTGALHGFCATIWNKIPALMKSKPIALSKLNKFLKRAKKFGYIVE